VPDALVYETLYCPHCCVRQTVTHDGAVYHCTLCKHEVTPPDNPEACPRSRDGQHNPYRQTSGWVCSQCLAPMDAPADAGTMYLGRVTR
jgi:hypothetical protein